jgi:hypothetical protein
MFPEITCAIVTPLNNTSTWLSKHGEQWSTNVMWRNLKVPREQGHAGTKVLSVPDTKRQQR